MDDHRTDSQLTEAIGKSEQEAFKVLFYRYHSKLFRFAVMHCRSRDLASDFVEEVFFRLWINREKLNPQKSVRAYLYKVLNNLIINQSKLASAKNISIEGDLLQKTLGSSTQYDSQIDIHIALEKLPNKLKNVFLLLKVDGLKYEEVAEICGISIKAVEKRMSKALNLLRTFLA